MTYTPTTWATGDTITAAGLNKMEHGIADNSITVILSEMNAVPITFNGWSHGENAFSATVPMTDELAEAVNASSIAFIGTMTLNGTTIELPFITWETTSIQQGLPEFIDSVSASLSVDTEVPVAQVTGTVYCDSGTDPAVSGSVSGAVQGLNPVLAYFLGY